MKRMLIWLLIVQLISGNTFAEGLLRIPQLIEHYHHHLDAHPEAHTDPLGFLEDHYAHEHQDEHEHDHLPFHHDNHCGDLHTVTVAILHPAAEAPVTAPGRQQHALPQDDLLPDLYQNSIWQPPKLG